MNVHVARILLVQHRQDYNRNRLAWLPARLYRSWREAIPKFQESVRGSWNWANPDQAPKTRQQDWTPSAPGVC